MQSGDIDEEALHAVLAGLDLSEYIPSTTFSSADADLEDELVSVSTMQAHLLELLTRLSQQRPSALLLSCSTTRKQSLA